MPTIDLNADLGEGMGDDLALLEVVTSANVACGAHAGDRATARATVGAAVARGITVGAHPSYEDRANYGRTVVDVDGAELTEQVLRQLAFLDQVAAASGGRVAYVKPHGALYNAIVAHEAHAAAVVAVLPEAETDRLAQARPGQAVRIG